MRYRYKLADRAYEAADGKGDEKDPARAFCKSVTHRQYDAEDEDWYKSHHLKNGNAIAVCDGHI